MSSSTSTAQGASNAVLGVNAGAFAPLLLSRQTSAFDYLGYIRHANFVITHTDVEPLNSAVPGGVVNLELPHNGDLLGPIQVMYTAQYQAFARAGAAFNSVVASPYASWVGGVGYRGHDTIEAKYGSHRVYYAEHLEHFLEDALYTNQEAAFPKDLITGLESGRLGIDDHKVKSGLAAGAAVTSGGAITQTGVAPVTVTKDIIHDIPVPWAKTTRTYAPYFSLANKLRLNMRLTAHVNLLDTNLPTTAGGVADPAGIVTSSFAVVNYKLRCTFVHISDEKRAQLNAVINGTKAGLFHKISVWETQKNELIVDAPTPLVEKTINLTNLRAPVQAIYFVLRKTIYASPNPASAAPYASQPYFFVDVDRYRYMNSAGDMFPEVDHKWALFYYRPRHHTNKLSTFSCYPAIFTLTAERHTDSFGFIDFGNTHSPRLVIKRDSGLTGATQANPPGPFNNGLAAAYDSSNVIVDVVALTSQFYSYQGGDWKQVIN